MKTARAALLGLLVLAGCQSSPVPSGRSRAEAILAQSKEATGGPAWDQADGCHEQGVRGDGEIAYTTSFSLRRYGMRIESRRGASTQTIGFNGVRSWRTDPAGETRAATDADALQEAVTTTYLSNNGFFYPDRFPAAFRYVRTTPVGGRTFDIVEIAPAGGRAFEVWFDRNTHLIDRVIDHHGAEPVIVEAADYRRIDGLTIATTLKVMAADGAVLDTGRVTAFRCGAIDGASFDPPADTGRSR